LNADHCILACYAPFHDEHPLKQKRAKDRKTFDKKTKIEKNLE